jgi:hypothetical protein
VVNLKNKKKVRNIDILIENDEMKEQFNYTEATEFKNISMMNDKTMHHHHPDHNHSDS